VAILDGLVSAMFQFRGDGLLLQAGQPAVLVTGTERRAITAQAASHDQLVKMLGEIAPAEAGATFSTQQHVSFPYRSPAGAVIVNAFAENGLLRIHVLPADRPAPPEPEVLLQDVVEEPPRTPAKPAPKAAAPAVRAGAPAIERLFMVMVQNGCSDLHLSSGTPPTYRLDGEILPIGDPAPVLAATVEAMLREIMPPKIREQFEAHHDADWAYEILGVARFRCNAFVDRKGPGGVFRIIPAKIVDVEHLGLSKSVLDLCDLPKGLVLVTGPTGSGKSTTLAAMIDYINRRRTSHIITIEDPIEFVHENRKSLVNQREVGPHTESFRAALRAALREDPDIVLVGEMRDLETISIAIETAETGHLVFGTLHTNTAASTVDRIIDQFPHEQQEQIRTMLAEALKGVISQTLCKKRGGGRAAAHEVLIVTPSISNLIREGKTFQITSIMQAGRGLGMTTMNDALLELVKKKLVEPEEAYARAVSKSEFRAALAKIGVPLVES
jgi:twitching motility protein PilT